MASWSCLFLLLDIPDVFLILCGKQLPVDKGVIYKRLVQLFVSEFLNSITPTLLIPYLLREGVLDNREAEKVKFEERSNGKWRAAWYLLFYLPQREADWLDIILEALTASKHPELARQLENTCASKSHRCPLFVKTFSTENKFRIGQPNALFISI